MSIVAMPFKYNTNIVSEEAYNEHIKLYNGYVNKINEIDGKLESDAQRKDANSTYSHYRGLKKGENFAIDAIILHEAYFQNIGNEKTTLGVKTQEAFAQYFDDYEKWAEDFKACAKSARGWCVLVYEHRTGTFRNILTDSHDDGQIIASYPVIVLDMYEHAYFMDYGIEKEKYIENFINYINWDIIEKRVAYLGIL